MATAVSRAPVGVTTHSIRIPPYHYVHILDRITNVTRLEIGPQTYVKKEDETIVTGDRPIKMIVLPPRHYCEITDPVVRNEKGEVEFDQYKQAVIKYGEVEYRFAEQFPEPFPLYPIERLTKAPTLLTVVKENNALKIEASRNFVDLAKKEKKAGDRWLFPGPATYYPRVEERIVELVGSITIAPQHALKLRASQEFIDRTGVKRKMGEEWLVKTIGSYLPDVYEEVVEVVYPHIITDSSAIQLRALRAFLDEDYKKDRKAGEEWIVTKDKSSFHITDVTEEFVQQVPITILSKDEYCVILDPFDVATGKNKLGSKKLVVGEVSFFLQPGESLEGGILPIYVLAEDEALLLRAKEFFVDKKDGLEHQPGDRWMVYGPARFVPPTEIEILSLRKRIPLDKNEGIYVRDTREGSVRPVVGETYMLKPHEELWEMELAETVEELIAKQNYGEKRDKTKVVFYKCPFNHVVQVYDYKKKESRVVFGPDLLMLGPDEQFTVTVLSGSKPKKPGVIKTIDINMGPEFSTDVVVVETLDHARLKLQLSYNWYFRVNRTDKEEAAKIFNVKDFIGDMCNLMASKVRAAVAGVSFEAFHKSSAKLIRKAIFGVDKSGKIIDDFVFPKNNLVITNVDIQSVEPVDEKTQKSLQNSVQLAIERTTKNQEDKARIQAEKMEQEAMGELEKQKIEDQAKAEAARKRLLEIQAECASVQNTGQAIADAKARAKADEIDIASKVDMAELKAKASKIEYLQSLKATRATQDAQISFETSLSNLEIDRAKRLAEIESKKFEDLIESIGRETLVAMAQAGPEFQAKLLSGLGLSGYLITDGNNPINLFNTASDMISTGQQGMNLI